MKKKLFNQQSGFDRLEFHRAALALIPKPDDTQPGLALLLPEGVKRTGLRTCTCLGAKGKTCVHVLELARILKNIARVFGPRGLDELFRASLWFKLGSILGEGCRLDPAAVRLRTMDGPHGAFLAASDEGGGELFRYYSMGPDALRLAERFGLLAEQGLGLRNAALEKLFLLTLTEQEGVMFQRGHLTIRLAQEKSLWHRLSYHCFMEFGPEDIQLEPAIDHQTGEFTVGCRPVGAETAARLVIPRTKVKNLLTQLKSLLGNEHGLAIHPIPLKSIFNVSRNTELDLEVRPMIELLQRNGEKRFFESRDFEKFRYGSLVYLRDLGLLAELERDFGPERKFQSPVIMKLKNSQVPEFLEELGEELNDERFVIDSSASGLRIIRDYDRLEVSSDALDRDWCWLDVRYGFGSSSISLAEILKAREEGERYVSTRDGWVDTRAEAFDRIGALGSGGRGASSLRMSRAEFFRLAGLNPKPLQILGESEPTRKLRDILDLQPAETGDVVTGLNTELRPYQKLGFQWLRFLTENGLGGLLCDEMGLGKTHQALALLASLREKGGLTGPVLVVCPTTVLGHWLDKVDRFAPGLRAAVHYGHQRDFAATLNKVDVVITSFGLVLQDAALLEQVDWFLIVFDEIQYLKNEQTQTYEAAQKLRARAKLGLTGTPIENRLEELRALFDLVLPGYLGDRQEFKERYLKSEGERKGAVRRAELVRLVSPFVLRRLKRTVLLELPDKIEDCRTCALSDDQVRLYRDAIESRGRGLVQTLREGRGPIPYIHIFALLNLLKRICDHPALAAREWQNYRQFESGKWELFQEALRECLDSGEKVVVYSQYLDMIRIMEEHLRENGVGCVKLTGQSGNRDRIISRFDRDPDCRVFLGSLKAGGVGIDLVAASVVIHYDRWWNAAREDQATDRVHRIGQRKGVQVIKIITQGTLEEKIAAIIEKKKNLMESVILEDDPGLLKTFSKEELVDLLSYQAVG
ncbi:MAG: DEAD/DEAH box helicase [Pseudomonadota bacterium]